MHGARMTVEEIARRLDLGERAVYAMLEAGVIPGIRVGRRWIITRRAYETWEASCGSGCAHAMETSSPAGLSLAGTRP